MSAGYPIPAGIAVAELVEARSRFVCRVGRADSVQAAREFIDALRTEHNSASAVAYAYCVGHGSSVIHGSSDGGEPKGTAGQPMLAILKGCGAGDIVAATARYFGGTKLGTGGLVRAFSDSLRDALRLLPLEQKVARCQLLLTHAYGDHDKLMHLLKSMGFAPDSCEFGGQIDLRVTLPVSQSAELVFRIRDLTAGRCAPVQTTPSV